jgi:prophage regulatory protein
VHPAAYNARRDASLAGTGKLDTIPPETTHHQGAVDAGVNGAPRAPPLQVTDSFVREPECRLITGLSRVTRWRLEREGKFPRRRRLSSGAIGWLRSEIATWVATRAA